jgi:WhiB family redox-sensing transcriptional regulator
MKDWQNQAECRFEDPELFFPTGSISEARLQTADAKAVCGRCMARSSCLEWALATGQTAGVWGGKSPRQRKEMHRPRATSLNKCLSQRAWIEKQIDRGTTQNAIARQLHVDKTAVSKAIRLINAERQAAAAQGVTM